MVQVLIFSPFHQGELIRAMGGAEASTSLLGVPLGHNSSFLQGPAFAPPRIREAIWCGSTNSSTEEGEHFVFLCFLVTAKIFHNTDLQFIASCKVCHSMCFGFHWERCCLSSPNFINQAHALLCHPWFSFHLHVYVLFNLVLHVQRIAPR